MHDHTTSVTPFNSEIGLEALLGVILKKITYTRGAFT